MIRVGKIELVLDEAALNAVIASPSGPVGKELGRTGARIEGRAKELLSGELVGVVTGQLRAGTSWRLFVRGGQLGVAVSSSAPHAIHVHEGTERMPARRYLTIAANEILGKSIA